MVAASIPGAGLRADSSCLGRLQSGETELDFCEYVAEALEAEAVGFVVDKACRDLVAERGDDGCFEGIRSLDVVLVEVVIVLCGGAVVGGHALCHCHVLRTAGSYLSVGEDVCRVGVPDIRGEKGVCNICPRDGEAFGDVVNLRHEFCY